MHKLFIVPETFTRKSMSAQLAINKMSNDCHFNKSCKCFCTPSSKFESITTLKNFLFYSFFFLRRLLLLIQPVKVPLRVL